MTENPAVPALDPRGEVVPRTYLPETPFRADDPYYSVTVEVPGPPTVNGDRRAGGVTVYSECCADTMSVETARALRDAIDAYLRDLDAAVTS